MGFVDFLWFTQTLWGSVFTNLKSGGLGFL